MESSILKDGHSEEKFLVQDWSEIYCSFLQRLRGEGGFFSDSTRHLTKKI